MACGYEGQEGCQGFYDAGEDSLEECFSFFYALGVEGHGDDGALREVLDGDAKGQGKGAGGGEGFASGYPACQDDSDCHALRDVVEGDGEYEHGGPL